MLLGFLAPGNHKVLVKDRLRNEVEFCAEVDENVDRIYE
jgi:hypothetical protein